jgi:hypothetical protein
MTCISGPFTIELELPLLVLVTIFTTKMLLKEMSFYKLSWDYGHG